MIKTPSIIIVSGGRTGTTYFADLLGKIMENCVALHEPGAIKWKTLDRLPWTMQKFGFFNITLKKILHRWGISSISNGRIYGRLTEEQAVGRILEERRQFIDGLQCAVYAESSYHYYGIIDILPRAFENLKVVLIVRDGYDWVRSHMNKRDWYAVGDIHRWMGMRLEPCPADGAYYDNWRHMSQFEKTCWSWTKINSCALEGVERISQGRLFRFEDLFISKDKYAHLKELLDFCASFPKKNISYEWREGVLEKKINEPAICDFPAWADLPQPQKEQFKRICGPLMLKLGYEILP